MDFREGATRADVGAALARGPAGIPLPRAVKGSAASVLRAASRSVDMLWARLACSVLVACSACGPTASSREDALLELEQLAFVPAGSVRLSARQGPDVVCENARPLLVDRFEVPRSAWLRHQRERMGAVDPLLEERTHAWSEDTGSWAATWMTLDEARAFAAARGMRLLSAREWLRVACGTRGSPYPWGQTRAKLVANTVELALSRPVAVGTFELGATPFQTYEMTGNVWEWVEEPIDDGGLGAQSPLSARAHAWALGGSFASPLRRLYDIDADGRLLFDDLDLDPNTRGEDIGLRCVADAREYLVDHAARFGGDEGTHARLVAVGKRFGRDAVPLLEEVARSTPGSAAIGWLYEGAQR